MRSIKAKILVSMVLTLAISLILVGGASCILSYRGTQSTLEASMKEMAVVAADRVSYELQAYRNIVGETGSTARLSNPEITLAEKQDLLQQKVDTYGFQRYNLLNTQGRSLIDGSNYSYPAPHLSILPDWSGNNDRHLTGNRGDQWLGDISVPLHCGFEIGPVAVI